MTRNDMELTRIRNPRVFDASSMSFQASDDTSVGTVSQDQVVLSQNILGLLLIGFIGIGLSIGLACCLILLMKKKGI
jgi:hypothetical protein